MTGSEALLDRLRRLRTRLLRIGGLSGVTWALVGLIIVWLALAWLDLLFELSPSSRLTADIVALTSGLILLVLVVQHWRRRGQEHALARWLDHSGDARGQIVAGYELSRVGLADTERGALSESLAAIAVDRAASLAATIPPEVVVRLRVLRRSATSFGVLAFGVVCLALVMPRLAVTQWARFFDPYGDHPPYSRVRFVVVPGDARVLYGNALDVQVTTDGVPVEQVELIYSEGDEATAEPLAMFPDADGGWRAVLTNITASGQYYVRAGRSRSERYALEVITVPNLEQVRFRVTPPAYTRRPAYEGRMPVGGIAGLPQTEVQVWAKSNRPLSNGTLTIVEGELKTIVDLAPPAQNEHEVTATFLLTTAGKFAIQVQDVAGVLSQDVFTGNISLLADEYPMVRMIQPAATSLATPEATLPVVLSGEDDCGIARLQLYRSLNDSRGLPMDFTVPEPTERRFAPTQSLPLSAYGLMAGDVIKLYARIEDNDPAGAKGSESLVCEIRIISQADYEQMLRRREGLEVLASKYRQAARRLESLTEEREGLRKKMNEESDGLASPETREALSKLAEKMRADAKANRDALEHLLPYDLDAALTERLAKLADVLESAAKSALDLADGQSLSRADLEKLLDQLEAQLAAERQEFNEEAIEPIEHLEEIFPLIEDQSRFVEIYQQQRELSERLASLDGQNGEDDPRLKARMRDLEAEQQRLRLALDELLGDIENHAMRLPEDDRLDDLRAQALKFVDAVRSSPALEQMANAEAGLAEFAGTKGYQNAKSAAETLEQFIERSSGIGKNGRMCLAFQPKLQSSLGSTVDQLLAELGLSAGDGVGSGTGGGYGARRSTLNNVGLYGQMPGVGELASNGSGRNGEGVGRSDGSGSANSAEPLSMVDSPGTLRASGGSGASIPAAYRRRVGAYFQRLAEENMPRK